MAGSDRRQHIFPKGLYHPRLGDQAAARLYENYELSMRLQRRLKRDKDTYFNRMEAGTIQPA